MDDSTANSMSSSQELDMSSNGDSYQGLPSSLVEAEERRRKSSESSMSGGNAPERGATTPSALGSPRGGDISSSSGGMLPPPSSPVSRGDQLHKRIESLVQQNRVLKCELETYKCRVKSLQEENRNLRQASVHIQAKAEQEEEFISNTLLKKIQALKKEKENLALNYEQEEECLTNDLSRKLDQLRQEKVQLEHTLEQEQECLVNKLMRRIEKLETETTSKQTSLETLRREKVELENTLEQEQEALVNKLWKRMDQLETEKRSLQVKLDKPISEPESPRSLNDFNYGSGDTAANLANNIRALKQECVRLKHQLISGKQEHEKKMAIYAKEEKEIREENLRLQRRLQLEMERREALCRHLSESESSLEMEEERVYNEMSLIHNVGGGGPAAAGGTLAAAGAVHAASVHRTRTVSSPVPVNMNNIIGGPGSGIGGTSVPVVGNPAVVGIPRPLSPGLNYGERRSVESIVGVGPNMVGFTPPPIGGKLYSLTTPPGVPSPSPPPSVQGATVQPGMTPIVGPGRAAAFVRPTFSHQGSVPMFVGQMVSPPHPNATSASVSSSSAAAYVYDKPPASPMDTSDNNISSHSISSTNAGGTSKNTSVVNIVHTSTPNKSQGKGVVATLNSKSPASQQPPQSVVSKSNLATSGELQQQHNVNKNIVSDTTEANSDGSKRSSTDSKSSSS